jgi:hypothetical protein
MGIEVDILFVHCHILCVRSADGAVNEELDCQYLSSWCSRVTWVVYSVAPRDQPCLVWFLYFFRSDEVGD